MVSKEAVIVVQSSVVVAPQRLHVHVSVTSCDMAYSLLCSHIDKNLPSVSSVESKSKQWSGKYSSRIQFSEYSTYSKIYSKTIDRLKISKNKCKYSSDVSLVLPSSSSSVKSEMFSYSSCPGRLYSDNSDFNALHYSEDMLCFQSRDLWPSCPGDVCTRCQDSVVTINNRCVCLCQTADCPHKNLRFKHYYLFDEFCRPSFELQGYRLLENAYRSILPDEETCDGEGKFRFNFKDSSSDGDDTSSESSSSSSSSSNTTTSSSSSFSSSSESNKYTSLTCS